MLIRITDIPASGLKINETMDLEPLNLRLQEGKPTEIRFTAPPQVNLVIHRTSSGAEVTGKLRAKLIQPCSRCVAELERELELEINYTLQQLTPRSSPITDETDQDIGMVYFDGEHVELDETLQESLILGLDLFWHPPLRADGSCTQCGLSKLEGTAEADKSKTKLGDLFKKAGLN